MYQKRLSLGVCQAGRTFIGMMQDGSIIVAHLNHHSEGDDVKVCDPDHATEILREIEGECRYQLSNIKDCALRAGHRARFYEDEEVAAIVGALKKMGGESFHDDTAAWEI